jgi:hypothetical protein
MLFAGLIAYLAAAVLTPSITENFHDSGDLLMKLNILFHPYLILCCSTRTTGFLSCGASRSRSPWRFYALQIVFERITNEVLNSEDDIGLGGEPNHQCGDGQNIEIKRHTSL